MPQTFNYLVVITEKVEIPHNISEEEEMALYEQDQIWLREAKAEGRMVWIERKEMEHEFDLHKTKVQNQIRRH